MKMFTRNKHSAGLKYLRAMSLISIRSSSYKGESSYYPLYPQTNTVR